jgi:raffinose/stachyose/melibiose transport system permease protein
MGALATKRRRTTNIAAVVFLAPTLFFLTVFIAYPIINSFELSLFNWNAIAAERTFVGLRNWRELIFEDRVFWHAFRNNLVVVVFSLLLQVPFALALATFLDAGGKKFDIFKVIWFLPLLMSTVAVGFLFRFALDANFGIVTFFSQLFGGGAIDLLGNHERVLLTVIGVICWRFIPFYMILYLAGYSTLPEETYEAAIIDGASRNQYFWRVGLPLLAPTIRNGAVLSVVGSLSFFDLVFVMTGGGPGIASELMATYMYRTAFASLRMGYGATIASAMFILITVIALVFVRILTRKEKD